MNLNESFDVSPGKVEALLARMKRLGVDPAAIEESFINGGGKGGQKINKTANCVQLRYAPLALVVRCQRERRRTVNRFLALRELVDRVEMKVSPGTSERLREFERLRRNKLRGARRRRGTTGRASSGEERTSMHDDQWKGHVRALIYPVQFSKQPVSEVDRVLNLLLDAPDSPWKKDALEEAVRLALTQMGSLAGLIPQDHSEAVIRAYLEAVLKKLGGR